MLLLIAVGHCVLMKNMYLHTAGLPAVNVASLTLRVDDGTFSDPSVQRYRCFKISHAYIFGLLNYRSRSLCPQVSAKFLGYFFANNMRRLISNNFRVGLEVVAGSHLSPINP